MIDNALNASASHSKQDGFSVLSALLELVSDPGSPTYAGRLSQKTLEPQGVTPLHSHHGPELLYVLEGNVEVCQAGEGTLWWAEADAGSIVSIPAETPHRLRNP